LLVYRLALIFTYELSYFHLVEWNEFERELLEWNELGLLSAARNDAYNPFLTYFDDSKAPLYLALPDIESILHIFIMKSHPYIMEVSILVNLFLNGFKHSWIDHRLSRSHLERG
jgi:hypothetical protein